MTTNPRRPAGLRTALPGLAAPVVELVLDSIDPDDVLARVDVRDLVERARVADIVRAGTQDVAGSALDAARRYTVGLDVVVTGALRRVLGRDPSGLPVAPASVTEPPAAAAAVGGVAPVSRSMTGRYAGLVTRLLANALDAVFVLASYVLLTAGVSFVLEAVFGVALDGRAGPVWLVGTTVWSFLLLWSTLAATGRTPGGAVLGLRVVRRDGSPLSPARAAVRVVALPLSALVFGLGYLGIVLDRERRALHDLVAGSTVVYDWGGTVATLPTPLDRWLARHEPAEQPAGRRGSFGA